jgi:uncharacterized protein YkuJ
LFCFVLICLILDTADRASTYHASQAPGSGKHADYRLSRTGDVICRVTFARDSLKFHLSPTLQVSKDLKPDDLVAKFKLKTSKEKLTSVAFGLHPYCFAVPHSQDLSLLSSGKSEMMISLTLSTNGGSSGAKLLPPLCAAKSIAGYSRECMYVCVCVFRVAWIVFYHSTDAQHS